MIDRIRVIYHLENWARDNKHWKPKLGHPPKVAFATSSGTSFGEMFDRDEALEVDKDAAEKMDAAIYSLNRPQYQAIELIWLGMGVNHMAHEYDYETALEDLPAKMEKKGIYI